jgi:cell division protein FtsW
MTAFLSKYFKGDKVIWTVIIALFLLSILTVYSATASYAFGKLQGDTTYYLYKQLRFLMLGLFVTYLFHRIPYEYFSRLSQMFIVLAVILLFATLVFGRSTNDASRWLHLPGGITFQTSDFAKVALLMYVARILSRHQRDKEDIKMAFKPIMVAVIIICGLILPENFSTSALLFGTCFILMFIGRVSGKYLWSLAGILGGLFIIFIIVVMNFSGGGRVSTWKNRVENFFNDESKANFQADQSKIAIVSGGILGKGPGKSTQRRILPHGDSDFIYAIVVEEYGLMIGGVGVVLAYLILLYRAGVIVRKSSGTFAAFLAAGLTLSLVIQAFTNMAVAVGLFPVTGQPLPLLSRGGTSIIFTSMALGMILSVSRATDEPTRVVSEDGTVQN